MKLLLLSKSYAMKETFTQADFFRTAENWLMKGTDTRALGSKLASSQDKESFKDADESKACRLETMCHKDAAGACTAVMLVQENKGTTWTTEVILETRGRDITVYIHISSSKVVTKNSLLYTLLTGIVREILSGGFAVAPAVPFTDQPVEVADSNLDWVAAALSKGCKDPIPVVIASQCRDSISYDVNVDRLAKDFYGMAYILTADDNFTLKLKNRGCKPPYYGAVAVYMYGECIGQFQDKRDAYYGNSLDNSVENVILKAAISGCRTAPTWESIENERNKAKTLQLEELVTMYDYDNSAKDDKLDKASKSIDMLWNDNVALQSRVDSLQAALKYSAPEGAPVLNRGAEPDLYDGEAHDMVLSILRSYLPQCPDGSRMKELLQSVLDANELVGRGKEIFNEVKRIFAGGEDLTAKDRADLRRLGFEVTGESNHIKLVFMGNPKYMFTEAKTPSDVRSGRNFATDIISQLNIYK